MKRVLVSLLIFVLLLSFAACSDEKIESKPTDNPVLSDGNATQDVTTTDDIMPTEGATVTDDANPTDDGIANTDASRNDENPDATAAPLETAKEN